MKAQSLEKIADMAGITVEELLEISRREPQIAALLQGVPRGTPDNGIPLKPVEFERVRASVSDE